MHGEPIPILLIEDDAGDATALRFALDRSAGNYVISPARCLRRGVELAQTNAYQIILTDLGLPDSIGFEAVEQLSHASPRSAIIVISGQDKESLYVDALEHGADSYMCKSELTPVTIHRCIQQSLHRIRQSDEIRRLVRSSSEQRQRLEEQSRLLASKNQRLEQLCQTSQEFVNNVSHEFRTPLCVVKQYASLIADGAVGPVSEEQRKMLGVIEGRVDDLNTIVDDMLDISRHESGLLAASRVECSASDIVERIIPGLQQRARLRGIELSCEVPDELPTAYCDPEKISRVLINLIVNALKFCNKNDSVVVRVSESLADKELRFEVCDSGPGIESKQRDLIFARFQQGDTHLQSSTKGFGLGLSIAKELVELNLGEISLKSVVGKGSTFSFDIPVNDPIEVARRFLKRNKQAGQETLSKTCIVRAIAEEDLAQRDQREVHGLLNHVLRSNDLLLPVTENHWLLVLSVQPDELPMFFQKAESEMSLMNRNRPEGRLPSVTLESVGELAVENAQEQLFNLIQRGSISSVSANGRLADQDQGVACVH